MSPRRSLREIEVAASTVQTKERERIGTRGGGRRRRAVHRDAGEESPRAVVIAVDRSPLSRSRSPQWLPVVSRDRYLFADVAFLLSVKRTPSAGPSTVTPKHCTYVRVQILPTNRPGNSSSPTGVPYLGLASVFLVLCVPNR